MRLFPSDKDYPTGVDAWGFPMVWVPFGKKGKIHHPGRIKDISFEELFIQESLDTLPGKPVYYFHPGAVTPSNFREHKIVGLTTDIYRISKDGLGGEVLVRMTDQEVYTSIINREITESSPGYGEPNGYRDYNHLAIVPPGYALGGDKMGIQLESSTPFEVYAIDNVNTTTKSMDTQLGEITAQNQMIAQQLDEIRVMLTPEMKEEATMEAAEMEQKYYQEGYAQGVADGQILVEAKAHGYEGVDPNEAKRHVVSKAFPKITLESKTPDFINGAYSGALSSLEDKKSSPQTPVTEPATITQESKPSGSIKRIPNGQK